MSKTTTAAKQAEKLENALKDLGLGDELIAYPSEGESGNAGQLEFMNESTDDVDFNGFKDKPVYSVNLLMSEYDDSRKRLIARVGEFVVAMDIDECRGETSYISGSALACEKGSVQEKAFVHDALLAILDEAATPLREAISSLKNQGLSLSDADKARIVAESVRL